MSNILAVVEQRDGTLRRVSHEVVAAARVVAEGVGGEVHALLIGGPGSGSGAGELGRSGAAAVRVVEHDAFSRYDAEGYTGAVTEALQQGGYFAAVFAGSSMGKDLAPRVAARLDVPLATDATELAVENGELVITRPLFAGKAFARLILMGEPRLVSVRPNIFRAGESEGAGAARVESVAPPADAGSGRVRVREVKAASGARVDVAEAPIVVAGGRGMRGPEHWHVLEELAGALGSRCSLGASRAVVDAGWRPHGEQVGQTGKTVSPQLYFAVGISGAIQHLAGMRTARTIVAINKDADAPIFKVADYGIVGDAFDVVPRLAEEIRKVCGE
jgi:electron transfer flavoprotein alpha subunit